MRIASPLLPDKLSRIGKICFQLSPFPVKYGNINNIITITGFGVTIICTGGASSLLSKESNNNSAAPPTQYWGTACHCTWINIFSEWNTDVTFLLRALMTATSAASRSPGPTRRMTASGAATSSLTSSTARGGTARRPRWVGLEPWVGIVFTVHIQPTSFLLIIWIFYLNRKKKLQKKCHC